MTLPAINSLVCTGQFITCKIVVEVFLVKTHHIKIPPVVIAVATRAILALHIDRYVVAFIPIYQGLYLLVTNQAFVIGHLASYIVALGTLRHAFEVLVRVRQLTRR